MLQPSEERCFALVCDGMGGAKSGNIASTLAVELFTQGMEQADPALWESDPSGLLGRCAAAANEAVFRRSITDPDCEGMGTTAVAALVCARRACVLNIGDSRAYRIREQEGICRVTRDHSLVEDLVSRGEITPETARVHPQKNLITKALGVLPEIKSDFYDLTLDEGEFLLLCSDGLSNLMDDQEISYEVLYGGPAETCCERLLRLALERGAPDNVTVVLLQT